MHISYSVFVGFSILFLFPCCAQNNTGWPKPIIIEVTGDQYNWHFVYAGADGQLNTADDFTVTQNFKLPVNSEIALTLKSTDYIYTFTLSEFSASEMAIPGLTRTIKFQTTNRGSFLLKGDQMCGFTHESLFGKLEVVSINHFKNWHTIIQTR